MHCWSGDRGLINRSQRAAASSLGLWEAVEHLLCLHGSWRAGTHGDQPIAMVGVADDEIVCMQNERGDLYLESLENLLCLKTRVRVSLPISKQRLEWEHQVCVSLKLCRFFFIQRCFFSSQLQSSNIRTVKLQGVNQYSGPWMLTKRELFYKCYR